MNPFSRAEKSAVAAGALVLLAGAIGIVCVCTSDRGVIAPGAGAKAAYILSSGPWVVIASAAVTAIGLWIARRR